MLILQHANSLFKPKLCHKQESLQLNFSFFVCDLGIWGGSPPPPVNPPIHFGKLCIAHRVEVMMCCLLAFNVYSESLRGALSSVSKGIYELSIKLFLFKT